MIYFKTAILQDQLKKSVDKEKKKEKELEKIKESQRTVTLERDKKMRALRDLKVYCMHRNTYTMCIKAVFR